MTPQKPVTADRLPRTHESSLANAFANELRRSRWSPHFVPDDAAVAFCSGAPRRARHSVSDNGECPTDQKVGGSTPSERAELVEVTVSNIPARRGRSRP